MSKVSCLLLISILCLSTNVDAETSLICDPGRLYEQLITAIQLLKLKQLNATTTASSLSPPGKNHTSLRQEDDDDDLPFYVPAIANVVGAVLSQNISKVIEQSLTFIPPEINENIVNVLGLVANQVQHLIPTPATTTTIAPPPISVANVLPGSGAASGSTTGGNLDPQSIADIETWLAIALAQEINKTINAQEDLDTPDIPVTQLIPVTLPPPPPPPPQIPQQNYAPPVQAIIAQEYSAVTSAPITINRKFEISSGTSVLSAINANNGQGQVIYAPAYAPNYVETTTPVPVYAPAFFYKNFSAPTVIPVNSHVVKVYATPAVLNTTITTVSTTTEEPTTTEDEDEDYDEVDDKKRKIRKNKQVV